MKFPTLTVVIVNYNEREHLARVIPKLRTEFSAAAEILVVDNNSRDGSAEMVKHDYPGVRLIEAGANLMYGKGNNLGIARANGAWVMILNPDVDWQPGQLQAFQARAQTPAAEQPLGLFGPRLANPDGSLQRSAHHSFPNLWTVLVDYCLPLQQFWLRARQHPYLDSAKQHNRNHAVAHLTGVCLLFPRQVFVRSGGFDEDFTMYLEETEWQKRLETLGIARWFDAETTVTHFGSATKTFAQANRNYLWAWEHYAAKHWHGPLRRLRLRVALWLSALVSDACLLVLWLPSWLMGQPGRRIRHYLRQYWRLTINLLSYPTRPDRI